MALLALLAAVYVGLAQSNLLAALADGDALRATVADLGAAGPLLIVGLMTLAIVMSPIPSAPIALAAGSAYGHLWGTVYVATGAELGALVALATLFGIVPASFVLAHFGGELASANL